MSMFKLDKKEAAVSGNWAKWVNQSYAEYVKSYEAYKKALEEGDVNKSFEKYIVFIGRLNELYQSYIRLLEHVIDEGNNKTKIYYSLILSNTKRNNKKIMQLLLGPMLRIKSMIKEKDQELENRLVYSRTVLWSLQQSSYNDNKNIAADYKYQRIMDLLKTVYTEVRKIKIPSTAISGYIREMRKAIADKENYILAECGIRPETTLAIQEMLSELSIQSCIRDEKVKSIAREKGSYPGYEEIDSYIEGIENLNWLDKSKYKQKLALIEIIKVCMERLFEIYNILSEIHFDDQVKQEQVSIAKNKTDGAIKELAKILIVEKRGVNALERKSGKKVEPTPFFETFTSVGGSGEKKEVELMPFFLAEDWFINHKDEFMNERENPAVLYGHIDVYKLEKSEEMKRVLDMILTKEEKEDARDELLVLCEDNALMCFPDSYEKNDLYYFASLFIYAALFDRACRKYAKQIKARKGVSKIKV